MQMSNPDVQLQPVLRLLAFVLGSSGIRRTCGLLWIASPLWLSPAIALPITDWGVAPHLPSPPPPNPALPSPTLPALECTSVSERAFYGHLPYDEAEEADLVSVGNGVLMHREAAASFERLRRDAADDGVSLTPLSGFRNVLIQDDLFYGVAADRGQTPAQRALVSAPPGHSEHHTGYAIDIGDSYAAWADLSVSFESTAAGRWLAANAAEYGFELSFPPEHTCVSYEPWHWRWVGDDRSQTIFETARRYDAQAGIERETSFTR